MELKNQSTAQALSRTLHPLPAVLQAALLAVLPAVDGAEAAAACSSSQGRELSRDRQKFWNGQLKYKGLKLIGADRCMEVLLPPFRKLRQND